MFHPCTYASIISVLVIFFSSPLISQDRGALWELAATLCKEGIIVPKIDTFTLLKWELPARVLGPLEDKVVVASANDCRNGVPIDASSFRMFLTRVTQQASDRVPGIYEAYVTSLRGELLQAHRFESLVPPGCRTSACFIRNNYSFNPNDETRVQFEQLKAFWLTEYHLLR